MKIKRKFKWKYINGLTQTPKDHDFHITPVLTFARLGEKELDNLGNAWGMAIEWGHWAVGFGVYNVYLNDKK